VSSRESGRENKTEGILRECSAEYQDALLLLGQSEGSRVLLEEGYWSVEMEEIQEHEIETS